MNEKDIIEARKLLQAKREIKWAIEYEKESEETVIHFAENPILVRTSLLKEMLDKELNYINRMLKSLGVTNIK